MKSKKEIYSSYANCKLSWFFFDVDVRHRSLMTGVAMRNIHRFSTLIAAFLLVSTLWVPSRTEGQPRARVLILPFHVIGGERPELQDFSDHIARRLRTTVEQLGETVTLESQETGRKLLAGQDAPITDRAADEIASLSGADLVIYGFLVSDGSSFRMRGVMWDLHYKKAAVSTDVRVNNIHGLPAILELFVSNVARRLHGPPGLPAQRAGVPASIGSPGPGMVHTRIIPRPEAGPWRSPQIPTALRAVDIGDLDGDSRNETVFVDEFGVTVSRYEGDGLRPLAQFSEPPAGYVSAEVEDLDADGKAELLLCYVLPSGMESAILRYGQRDLEVVARFPHTILATIADPSDDKRRILVGQSTDRENIFDGHVTRFRVDNGRFVPDGELTLPAGTLVLSYASGRLGKDAAPVQIILNQDQRLVVFDRSNRLLAEGLGRIYGLGRGVRVPVGVGRRDIMIPGRLLITDTNGDGENELLVIKQTPEGSLIEALEWDGQTLDVKWRTIRTAGIISDFRVRDFKNAGIRSLVLLLVQSNPFAALIGGARSVVFAYDLLP